MSFIRLSDKASDKSFTSVENKFITKYMPSLDAESVKVYLYALYICKSGISTYTVLDLCRALDITENEALDKFEYLEDYELVSIVCRSPLEIEICDCENITGKPKKIKPEKYADLTKTIQEIISDRMITPNEIREYIYLMEEYGFEQDAFIQVVSYCVDMKGPDIRSQYIKKVAQNFGEDGIVTVDRLTKKLSSYTSSTSSLIKIFSAARIKKSPEVFDEKLYRKWTQEMGFTDEAIMTAARAFRANSVDKIDATITELYKNKKFDPVEIESYSKTQSMIYDATKEMAGSLGVYIQDPNPYIENYVNVWCGYGYSLASLKKIATSCFKRGIKSFESMDGFVKRLLDDGFVDDDAVNEKLAGMDTDDEILKSILYTCGLTRGIINYDRENLARWREWGFSTDMMLSAAKASAGKDNPIPYMNKVLSTWKRDGVFTADRISGERSSAAVTWDKGKIESHYSELRNAAVSRAERSLSYALADEIYADIYKQIKALSMKSAFDDENSVDSASTSEKIKELEERGDERLTELGLTRESLTPQYSCRLCEDTGYTPDGKPCECLKKLIGAD